MGDLLSERGRAEMPTRSRFLSGATLHAYPVSSLHVIIDHASHPLIAANVVELADQFH
jgi:hypothetical protein